MSYLENLQELDLKECENYDLYVGFLRDLDSTVYLKHIQRTYCGSPGYSQGPNAHFLTYYNFRTTITHAVVNFSRDGTLDLGG